MQVRSNDPAIPTGTTTLLMAAAPSPCRSERGAGTVAALTESQVAPLRAEALQRLRSRLTAEQLDWLEQIQIVITDLPDQQLGSYRDGTIWIDTTAAGYGWFLDTTPWHDQEFVERNGIFHAFRPKARDRIDLLTVLLHEFSHAAGLKHQVTGLMNEGLATGTRLLPDSSIFMAAVGLSRAPRGHRATIRGLRHDRRVQQPQRGLGLRNLFTWLQTKSVRR